jgi:hypothetical protein
MSEYPFLASLMLAISDRILRRIRHSLKMPRNCWPDARAGAIVKKNSQIYGLMYCA